MSEAAIWEHARLHALPAGRNIHGRADLTVGAVSANRPLRTELDEPPPRHANVVGWPKERDRQIALAQSLASAAKSVPPKD